MNASTAQHDVDQAVDDILSAFYQARYLLDQWLWTGEGRKVDVFQADRLKNLLVDTPATISKQHQINSDAARKGYYTDNGKWNCPGLSEE